MHAIATKRKQFEEAGDVKGLMSLPEVTVFEKATAPGGVWRSNRNIDGEDTSNGSTNMYEGLWINGPKYHMEYFDYSFEDHFKDLQPVYLPRQQVLEYILARDTQHEDIFEHVNFNTEVKSLTYDDQMEQFVVRTSTKTGMETVQHFDKCIWAAGINGKPKMIPEIVNKLSNFKGQIVHSAAMDKLASGDDDNAVKGKNILMIGDSYSAEDLALQCIKLGAEEITILSRNCEGAAACYMGWWPEDKVDIAFYSQVAGVKDDGTGTTILLESSKPEEYPASEVEDVSIIIFCTGYQEATDFLAENLKPFFVYEEHWQLQDVGLDPATWRMKDNPMTEALGHVEPAKELELNDENLLESCHRRLLISNPNMMILSELSNVPLLDIDVAAWLLLAYITGEKEIPTKEEMLQGNLQDQLLSMDDHDARYIMDENYAEACRSVDEGHWSQNYANDEHKKHYADMSSLPFRLLARDMNDGKYPIQIGDKNGLNKVGLAMVQIEYLSVMSRAALEYNDEDTKRWKTFRDQDPSIYRSYVTGNGSTALKGKWLEIDDEGNPPPNV